MDRPLPHRTQQEPLRTGTAQRSDHLKGVLSMMPPAGTLRAGMMSARMLWAGVLGAGALFLPSQVSAQAPTVDLIKDLRPGSEQASMEITLDFFPLGSQTVLMASDPEHGAELWISDGTALGTDPLLELRPGPADGISTNSGSHNGALLGSEVLFSGYQPSTGYELWKTDGTVVGTTPVADLAPGLDSSFPRAFTTALSKVFFCSFSGDGYKPWVTDGTALGSVQLLDIDCGFEFVEAGGLVYFSGGGADGYELYASDGTPAGTYQVADINAGPSDSLPRFLTALGSQVFFSADDGTTGFELWRSDGTGAGTQRVMDIGPPGGGGALGPVPIGAIGSNLLFHADDGVSGRELWKTNGTTTGLMVDIAPGPDSAFGQFDLPDTALLGGRLFFAANDQTNGREPWRSDGTAAGTGLLADIEPGGSSTPRGFIKHGGRIFFSASQASTGVEPWVTTGASTQLLQDLAVSGDSLSGNLIAGPLGGGSLLFLAETEPFQKELWITDGTPGTAQRLTDVQTSSTGSPSDFVELNGSAVFFADLAEDRTTLWQSEGSESTTVSHDFLTPTSADLNSVRGASNAADSVFLFNIDDPHFEFELWTWDGVSSEEVISSGAFTPFPSPFKRQTSPTEFLWSANGSLHSSDGTPVGDADNARIPDVDFCSSYSTSLSFGVLGNLVVYEGEDPALSADCELWVLDRVSGNTSLIMDFDPAAESAPVALGLAGGNIIVYLRSGARAGEFWATDGTPAGTVQLPLPTGFSPTATLPGPIGVLQTGLVISGQGWLWFTDGTPAGTVELATEAGLTQLATGPEAAYFRGTEFIWFTDGTPGGTYPVTGSNFQRGSLGANSLSPAILHGNQLIMSSEEDGRGDELILIDGPNNTLEHLPQVVPGPAGSIFGPGIAVGNQLFVTAWRADVGHELFGVDLTSPLLFTDGFESGDTSEWSP